MRILWTADWGPKCSKVGCWTLTRIMRVTGKRHGTRLRSWVDATLTSSSNETYYFFWKMIVNSEESPICLSLLTSSGHGNTKNAKNERVTPLSRHIHSPLLCACRPLERETSTLVLFIWTFYFTKLLIVAQNLRPGGMKEMHKKYKTTRIYSKHNSADMMYTGRDCLLLCASVNPNVYASAIHDILARK